MADIEKILEMRKNGASHAAISKELGISGNVITRVADGWRPVGKKPVKITKKRPDSGFIPGRRR